MLAKLARCGTSRIDSHICRNLNNLIHREKMLLGVKISFVNTHIRLSRRRRVYVEVRYPVLRLSDWAACVFQGGGHAFLGGKNLDHAKEFGAELTQFWKRFKAIEPQLRFFSDYDETAWSTSIPLALRGDEGRGRLKNPIMIVSYQTIMPTFEGRTNLQGYLE